MKTKIYYVCEYCGCQYEEPKYAYHCEAQCLGISIEEYHEYRNLLDEERKAYRDSVSVNNKEVRRRRDDASKAVIEFQNKHGIKPERRY